MLPTIADYSPPERTGLPANRVDWRIEPDRAVVLVHDMQQYFVDPYGPSAPLMKLVIENIRQIRRSAETVGVPVYFTAQPPGQAPEQRGLLTDFWGPGIQDDGRDGIVEPLRPVQDDNVITKWRYDAFARTDLEQRIRSSGRDQLIITGVYAHIGCLTTATSAFMSDIRAFFVADAMADFSAEYHAMALKYAAERCAFVLGSDDVIAQLTPSCGR